MNEQEKIQIHKSLAVSCFNRVWDLLDKADRTPEDDMKMIHTAHCSRYHWGEIGTPLEFQRGEWQISRVYSVLKMGEPALYHAKCCNDTCIEDGIGDFDFAFSFEALARAHTVLGNSEKAAAFRSDALAAAEGIEEKDNKDYFLSELDSIS